MQETKAIQKNNNERDPGLIKNIYIWKCCWMLLMFDLACRELQNPLEERMPFYGFLCEAASPILWEPHWALNPAHTLAVGVGGEHRLIWRKNWFTLQVETGIIHPQAMETETCSRHENSGLTGHQGCWCHCAFAPQMPAVSTPCPLPSQHRPFVSSFATTAPSTHLQD